MNVINQNAVPMHLQLWRLEGWLSMILCENIHVHFYVPGWLINYLISGLISYTVLKWCIPKSLEGRPTLNKHCSTSQATAVGY